MVTRLVPAATMAGGFPARLADVLLLRSASTYRSCNSGVVRRQPIGANRAGSCEASNCLRRCIWPHRTASRWMDTCQPSNAFVRMVRPLQLDHVLADLLGLPGADVTDLAVVVVVPALAWDRIGDGLAQLMRTRGRERVDRRQTSRASRATRIRHRRVEDLSGDVVVVPAERLA